MLDRPLAQVLGLGGKAQEFTDREQHAARTGRHPLKRMRFDDDTAFPPCLRYLYHDKHALWCRLQQEYNVSMPGSGVTVSMVADQLIAGYEPLDVQCRRTRVALARDTLPERAAALAKPLRRGAGQQEEPRGLVLVQD